MLVLEWLKKENKLSYILNQEFYDEYEDENVKYVLLPDDIIPSYDNKFLDFIHEQADLGKSILDANGNKTSHYDAVIVAWHSEEEAIKQEMKDILNWLKDHDYIINKKTLGEYTDASPQWVSYLEERAVKIARYNNLEVLSGGIT